MVFVAYKIARNSVAVEPMQCSLKEAEKVFRKKYPRAHIINIFEVEP